MDERKEHIYNALYLIAVCHDRSGQPAVPDEFMAGLKRRFDDAVGQEQIPEGLGNDPSQHSEESGKLL